MQTSKRTLFTLIVGLLLGTLAEGPALADTAPNAIVGVPVAEWIYNPGAISVTPAQGAVSIASATFTTTATNFGAGPLTWWPVVVTASSYTWSLDADASVVFQAQSSTTTNCTVSFTLNPSGQAQTGAGSTGYVTPNFSLGASATASSFLRGLGLAGGTTYTISAVIAASGSGCNEVQPPLVKFVLKARWSTP